MKVETCPLITAFRGSPSKALLPFFEGGFPKPRRFWKEPFPCGLLLSPKVSFCLPSQTARAAFKPEEALVAVGRSKGTHAHTSKFSRGIDNLRSTNSGNSACNQAHSLRLTWKLPEGLCKWNPVFQRGPGSFHVSLEGRMGSFIRS